MSQLQNALDALEKLDYAKVFKIIEEAGVTSLELNLLKKEFQTEGFKTFSYDRFYLALQDAFASASSSIVLPAVPAPPKGFIGRQEELKELHTRLQAGKTTVLVSGIGGIGKTALAQQYAKTHKAHYQHALWIRQNGHLLGSFIQEPLFKSLRLDIQKQENEAKAFENILTALARLQGTNLLLIDNYEHTDTDQEHDTLGKIFSELAAWRVLCTSRADTTVFGELMPLDALPPSDAHALFRQNAGKKPVDEAELDALLKMIGYHTLMTELLAKTYQKCLQFETVGKFHLFLEENSLQDKYLEKDIYVGTEKTTINKYLKKIFSLASLTKDEIWILKQWAVLPSTPHKAQNFLAWIQDESLAYENTLLALQEKGWLQTQDYLAYSLHPFLRLFLHSELKPTILDCGEIWEYFVMLMVSDEIQANPLAYQWTTAIGECLAKYINFEMDKKAHGVLCDRIRFIYHLLGNYNNAIKYAEKALNITEKAVGKIHQERATSLNNLALLYETQGNYEKAMSLHQEALQIRKEVLGIKHPNYATSLNNLALLYKKQGDYKEAFFLYQEALNIRKEVLQDKHPDYAMSLNNLASLYWNQENYAKALPLYQEALQIRKDVLGEKHPDYALSLHNLGTWYFKQGNYMQARQYLEEAYTIFVERLGEQHPYTQRAKKWLDDLPSS